jgi:WD40 repeat protein
MKYEMFPFHNEVIKTLSVYGNLLVFGSGNENDLVKVVKFEAGLKDISYKQIQMHKVMNTRQNFIEWSLNGQYLALGSERVTVWEYQSGVFSRFKEYPDELFEVTAFTWCPNSKKYAASGINTDLSIFIRNLETDEKLKEFKNEHKVLGLIWDPFDKHLASLLANN